MLADFFHLNDEAAALSLATFAAFEAMFANTNELINAAPARLVFAKHTKIFRDKRFKNVDFRNGEFTEITFTQCTFEDCIFVSCEFESVEFHRCRFINCNFYKATFDRVYLNINTVRFSRQLRRDYSNVILEFYQRIYANYQEQHQWKFSMYADLGRRRWDRYQTWYRIRTWKAASGREFLGSVADLSRLAGGWVSNILYGFFTRHGYGPFRFALFGITGVIMVSSYVQNHWPEFGFDAELKPSFPRAVFFVSTVLSTLGYSSAVPDTDFGLYFSSTLGLAGVAWTGIFIALLLRRFVR